MVRRRRAIGVLLGILMCLNTACYAFVPVSTGAAPKVGDQVRVRLTPDGTAGMAAQLGPGVTSAEGTLQAAPGGDLVVGVVSVRLTEDIDRSWNGENVTTFPARYVAGVDVRTLDASKTRVAAIGGGLAILAIFALALGTGGVHGGPDAGGTPPPP